MKNLITTLIVFFALAGGLALAQGQGALKPAVGVATPAGVNPQVTQAPVDSGPMPFSNEEANFYRRAWPIDKSHSVWALVLYGSVLVVLATLIIRAMAKSGPRKPPAE